MKKAIKRQVETAKEVKADKPQETQEALAALVQSVTMTDDAFNLALTGTVSKAEQAQQEIQALALSALVDCSQRKTADRVNALIKSLPDSQRKNSLKAWFDMFGAVKYDQGSKQFSYNKAKRANVWAANQKPWYKAQIEKPYEGFNMIDQLQTVYMRCVKKLENHKQGDNVTPELVNKFGAFIAEIKNTSEAA